MVRRERVEPIPNVQVQAVTGYNYEFGVQTAGVQIGIALPIFNRNQGTIREAMSDLSRDHAEYERVALSLRKRLAEVYTQYLNASGSVADFRAGSLPWRGGPMSCKWPATTSGERLGRRCFRRGGCTLISAKTTWNRCLSCGGPRLRSGGMLLVDGLSSPPSPTSQGHIEAVATPR